jgi:hypothetical protein
LSSKGDCAAAAGHCTAAGSLLDSAVQAQQPIPPRKMNRSTTKYVKLWFFVRSDQATGRVKVALVYLLCPHQAASLVFGSMSK